MKKPYTQPTLTTYGNVEKLTKTNGNGQAADFFNLADGRQIPGKDFGFSGSQDGVAIPNP